MKNSFYSRCAIIVCILLMAKIPALSQYSVPQLEKMIDTEIDSIRHDRSFSFDYRFDSSNEYHFFEFVKKYDGDKNYKVRDKILMYKAGIGLKSRNNMLRRKVVEDFVLACLDTGNFQYAAGRLAQFGENDFSEKAKNDMVNIFNQGFRDHDFLRACGTAQLKELLPKFKDLSAKFNRDQRAWFITHEWLYLIVAARLGDSSNADKIISSVELELNRTVLFNLLNDVGYTKLPDCFKLLQKYLTSNEIFYNCNSECGNSQLILQAALNSLAKYYEGFPIKFKKVQGYSNDEINIAKEFLKVKYQKFN